MHYMRSNNACQCLHWQLAEKGLTEGRRYCSHHNQGRATLQIATQQTRNHHHSHDRHATRDNDRTKMPQCLSQVQGQSHKRSSTPAKAQDNIKVLSLSGSKYTQHSRVELI